MSFWQIVCSLAMSNNLNFSNNLLYTLWNCLKNTHYWTLEENYLSKMIFKTICVLKDKRHVDRDACQQYIVSNFFSKFCICRFLPNWLRNFWYGKFFSCFFFKLFTIESLTNKDKLLRLVSIKRIKKIYISKNKIVQKYENSNIFKLWNSAKNSIFNFFNFYFL